MKLSSLFRQSLLATMVLGAIAAASVAGAGSAVAAPSRTGAAAVTAGGDDPRLAKLVAEAKHQTTLGISYQYAGGHGPRPAPLNSHVDCSGFVREMYNYAFGVDIGSGSGDSMIRLSGKFTRTSHPVPGDVALLGHGGSAPAYHSGIYIGNVNGHPAMIAAPTTGQNIKVQTGLDGYWSGDLMGYWHYNGASRVPAVVPPHMTGHFDSLTAKAGGVTMAGWALDPQRRSGAARIRISIDGRTGITTTRTTRADVNRALRVGGAHGFTGNIGAGRGRHTVCLTAQAVGSTTSAFSLGCRTVTVTR